MSDDGGNVFKNWIVNQNRHTINIYMDHAAFSVNCDILSWTGLDRNGEAFLITNYILSSNPYFTINTIGWCSYTLTKTSTPPVDNNNPVLESRFNPTKKYPLNLNFYWVDKVPT